MFADRELLLRLEFPGAVVADDHLAERVFIEKKKNARARFAGP